MEKVKFKKLKPDSNGNTCSIEHQNATYVSYYKDCTVLVYKTTYGFKAKLIGDIFLFSSKASGIKNKIERLVDAIDSTI